MPSKALFLGLLIAVWRKSQRLKCLIVCIARQLDEKQLQVLDERKRPDPFTMNHVSHKAWSKSLRVT